jgi:hypothetical protein
MASYWSFGHLQPKLWAKEGPGVKLAIWLPTTKSRESTSSRPPNWECDTALERCWQGLQLWFRLCCDRTLQSGVTSSQSPKTPTGTISGLQLGSPGKKSHLDVVPMEWRREYYMGEGGKVVASPESGPWWVLCVKVPVVCPNTQGCFECELTLLWLVLGCKFKLII